MAAPTQVFPPWLTASASVITNADGIPVTTSTTVLFLPLTYFGPSIPLNSDWTYGGLTSPASTATPSTSEVTSGSASITSAIPPTSTPTSVSSSSAATSITSSGTSSLPSSSVSLSSSGLSSLSSPSASISSSVSSPTAVSAVGNGLSRGQLIGVIVASILGAIFLSVIVFSIYLWCKGRRSRRGDPRFSMVTPIDQDYMIVDSEGRPPGEGSPRHSGEEADSFLQRSRVAGSSNPPMQQLDPEMGGPLPVSRVPVPPSGSLSSSGSSSTNHSGYGVLIERPTLSMLPSVSEELERQRRGHILSPAELRQMDEETVLPQSSDYSPLMPPPRLVDPDYTYAPRLDRPPFKSQSSRLSHVSDVDESATLLTARRVRVEDLVSRSPPQLPLPLGDASSSSRNSGGFLHNLGLGLANIGRLSWFKESGSRRNSHTPSYLASPLSDSDIEVGKAFLSSTEMSENYSARGLGVGLGVDGDRPMSSVSGRSGATIYHDATSSLPSTPLLPPPRALTPASQHAPEPGWPSSSTVASEPPAYALLDSSASHPTTGGNLQQGVQNELDVLDLPAPPAVSPFTSTSSVSSLHGTTTASSLGTIVHPFPPGLGFSTSKTLTDASSGATQSVQRLADAPLHDTSVDISIDVLEEEPPIAGEGWRSMAATIISSYGAGRRTTFGALMPPPDIISEAGSLYSMRSHLSPASSRSTGSAPASRRELSGSVGSASSRPSVRSGMRTGSSGHSLAHSGSLSHDERKRGHAISPTLSAFGHQSRSELSSASGLNAPPSAHFGAERADVARIVKARSSTTTTTAVDVVAGTVTEPVRPLSPSMQFPAAPWATGLDHDWAAT